MNNEIQSPIDSKETDMHFNYLPNNLYLLMPHAKENYVVCMRNSQI